MARRSLPAPWWTALALGTLLLGAAPARADLISPDEEACQGKRRDDRCEVDGRVGRCQPGQCCRNEYSRGADEPQRVCSPCDVCKQGGGDRPGDGEAGEKSGCALGPATGPLGPASLGGLALLTLLGLRRRR